MTFNEAYLSDETERWRKIITADHLRQYIRDKKEMVEWSKSELYPHPLKRIVSGKKPLLKTIINFFKCLIP